MLRAVSGLDRVRLRLDRVRAAVGEIDPVFLDTTALPCAPLGRALGCSVTLKVETLSPSPDLEKAMEGTIRTVCKVGGKVEFATPGSLPNDGKVIDDVRKYT